MARKYKFGFILCIILDCVIVIAEFPDSRELQILGKKMDAALWRRTFWKKTKKLRCKHRFSYWFLSKYIEDKSLSLIVPENIRKTNSYKLLSLNRKIDLIFQPSRKKFASNACLWIVPVARCSSRLKCVRKNDTKKKA